jgi:hypothetical protein
MPKFSTGIFTPKHPEKYIGRGSIRWRSSWELTFMIFLDSNPNILNWASEAIKVPYVHPITRKKTIYVPDFFVVYENKFGKRMAEVVEIKPKKQSIIESKTASLRDRAIVAINHAKWTACQAYCKQQGFTFRVITEDQIFFNGKAK